MSFLQVSGTAATRRSPSTTSFGIAIFMAAYYRHPRRRSHSSPSTSRRSFIAPTRGKSGKLCLTCNPPSYIESFLLDHGGNSRSAIADFVNLLGSPPEHHAPNVRPLRTTEVI